MSKRIALVVVVFLLILASAMGSAAEIGYYVASVGGDEGNNGASVSAARKTPAKVCSMTFGPGDLRQFGGSSES
jgi:hypothetical protein